MKDKLRTYYLQERKKLSNEEVSSRSKRINSAIAKHLLDQVIAIHIFIPIPDSNEINTWETIQKCWTNGIKTATSITKFKPKRLEHTWFDDLSSLTPDGYNVPVPTPISAVDINELDLVVVPLLCIDHRGNRIGYGQGFYDGFLGSLNAKTLKIGVSLFDVVPNTIQTDPWDIPLDGVITPNGLLRF